MGSCSVDGCNAKTTAKGLCIRHYNRLKRTGTTDEGKPGGRAPFEDRLWRYIAKGAPDECWPWTGKAKVSGYGSIGLGSRSAGRIFAHRAVWQLFNGEIPSMQGHHGAVVRHTCSNRICCNPNHLVIGTQADNVKDMWANKGSPRGNAKLNEAQIEAIRNSSLSSRKLAPIYGVTDAHIRSIRQRRCWNEER